MPTQVHEAAPTPARRRIHEAAVEAGLTASAIRYYEQLGLLRPARSGGAYRLYDRADIERLQAIRDLRDSAGFSLAEIAELLADEDAADQDRAVFLSTVDPAERRRLVADALAREDRHLALLRGKVERLGNMIGTVEVRRRRLSAKLADPADTTPTSAMERP